MSRVPSVQQVGGAVNYVLWRLSRHSDSGGWQHVQSLSNPDEYHAAFQMIRAAAGMTASQNQIVGHLAITKRWPPCADSVISCTPGAPLFTHMSWAIHPGNKWFAERYFFSLTDAIRESSSRFMLAVTVATSNRLFPVTRQTVLWHSDGVEAFL